MLPGTSEDSALRLNRVPRPVDRAGIIAAIRNGVSRDFLCPAGAYGHPSVDRAARRVAIPDGLNGAIPLPVEAPPNVRLGPGSLPGNGCLTSDIGQYTQCIS